MGQLINIQQPVTVCRASAGTGKTYTLAAYYVGLLLSGEDYRSILAITFTNKATAEMSERILRYLHAIAQGGERPFLARARAFMLRDANAPDELLEKRAEDCFHRMMLDYDNVHVQTIDSFLLTLMNGLAGVLRMSLGLNTELDIDHVIRQAVDWLLSTEMTDTDRAILEEYMQVSLDKSSRPDLRDDLAALVKELYNESVQVLDADGRILFNPEGIAARRHAIEEAWEQDEDLKELKQLLHTISPEGFDRYMKAAYERLSRSVDNPQKVSANDRFRGVESKYCKTAEMARATELGSKLRVRYTTQQLTIRYSREMELMASIERLIQRLLSDSNCALLARTAATLTKALRTGDADFILEKAGIRYHHILIDEFQDTSQLQWSVIRQLLMDVLAGAGNTLLIVGDIKQSIYRWRNGDWHIMDGLTDEKQANTLTRGRINSRFTSLTQNYRSSEEVVRFNLSLFDHILKDTTDPLVQRIYNEGYKPETIDSFYQADKKKGGYVRFRALPNAKKDELAMEMFDSMENALRKGVQPEQMLVLVRDKKEALLITDLKTGLSPIDYPLLSQVHIVSSDSYLLSASQDVQTVIAGLRVLVYNDDVAAEYITMVTGKSDVIGQIREQLSQKTPLYEAVCELVKILLTDEEGRYSGTETAYLNNLLDRTRMYVSAYGSNMANFLSFWNDTMAQKPIPASASDAIQILTIHSSKGLQAQTLFVPFCIWPKEVDPHHMPKVWCQAAQGVAGIEGDDFLPIQYGTDMALSAYQPQYEEERFNLSVDNLNLLYVALTRAEDNLFVTTSYSVNAKGVPGACNHVGKYIMDYVEDDEYEAGVLVVKSNIEDRTSIIDTAELWANSEQVRFVQSQEGALYTDYGDEAYRRVARMEEGTLCHEIFAQLHKADEIDRVLDDFETAGQIASKEQRDNLRALITSAWEGNETMRDWFTAPWTLRLEEAILIDRRELRPDRVMINPETNEAIVLDYKFGHWEDKYRTQVRDYMEALRRIGYSPVRGYLWFAKKNQLVEVKG